MQDSESSPKGFTIVEILIVIGIVAILLAMVFTLLNRRQNFTTANNSQRKADIEVILAAITQYQAAHSGKLPASIANVTTQVAIGSGENQVNLCSELVPTFIADIPIDPATGTKSPPDVACNVKGTAYTSGYLVSRNPSGNHVTIIVPATEESDPLSVTN